MDHREATLHFDRVPREVQRGLRIVSARRQVDMRTFVIGLLYAAIDEELSDYPEWRYQSERPVKKSSE